MQSYILSFSDNALSLKSFLNEEIHRLRDAVETGKKTEDFANDQDMIDKADKVLDFLNEFKNSQFTVQSLTKILKIQNLVSELGD